MGSGSVAALRPHGLVLEVEETEILRRIREGETELFGRLVEAHQKRIFRVVLYYVRDTVEADTLTQDTFSRAFEYIHRFRGEAQLETWLTRIAINVCLNYLKKRQQELKRTAMEVREGEEDDLGAAVLALPHPGASPEEQLLRREALHRVDRAVSLMSEHQKTVFLLRHYEGMSLEEIAGITRMNTGTIKSHLFRALQKVRLALVGHHAN